MFAYVKYEAFSKGYSENEPLWQCHRFLFLRSIDIRLFTQWQPVQPLQQYTF